MNNTCRLLSTTIKAQGGARVCMLCNVAQVRWKSSGRRRSHVPMAVPPERLEWSQFDSLDKKQPRVEFAGLPELESANEKVLKVLSLEFGTRVDLEKAKVLEYGKQLQRHPNDFDSPEMKVVQMTVHLRTLQEHYARIFRQDRKIVGAIRKLMERRHEQLEYLRLYRYESYAKILKIFDLKHKLPPLQRRRRSPLIDAVSDMRIRSFAEARRIKFEEEDRIQQLAQLKQQLKQQLLQDEQRQVAQA
uniref:Small ribosomal subunit protein uS15m n=1 Tax=Ciona savignyi TaxID=51511 RepID=H2YFS8_CIOSA